MILMNTKQPTPEELEAQRQEEIAERKAIVEADKQRRIAEREQRDRNLALSAKVNAEQQQRRKEAERAQLTEGLDKNQIEDMDRLYELDPQITRSSGTNREDLQTEYNTILQNSQLRVETWDYDFCTFDNLHFNYRTRITYPYWKWKR